MSNSANSVMLRVWGDFACFTRPEMKVERVSYPICTPSAARGILESIFWEPEIYYLIDSITVIKKGKWFSFRRNEVSAVISIKEAISWMQGNTEVKPIHADDTQNKTRTQRNMLALADVEYVIKAEIHRALKSSRHDLNYYVDAFKRRASSGKCKMRPVLGCREFTADFDCVDDPSSLQMASWIEEDLGIMLYDVFDPIKRAQANEEQLNVQPQAIFFNAQVRQGVMDCHPDRVKILRPSEKGVV